MVFWKRYFWFMTAMNVIFLLHNIAKPATSVWIDIILNVFTLLALFGFSFKKKLLFKEYWQAVFFLCAIFEVLNIFKALPQIFENNVTVILMVIWCIVISPIYFATFIYAFRNDAFWKSADKRVI